MNRRLLLEIHEYFTNIPKPARQEQDLLARITGELPFFHIISVHRDDLLNVGLDGPQATDEQMEEIADRMHEDYCEQLFHGSLGIIAEFVGVPRKKEKYVLVEFPEDASHFETNNIGYPCFNSEDNGARYVPEEEYIRHFGHEPQPNTCFLPVMWPESQEYMGDNIDSTDALCEAIMADEKALTDFGSSSIWVPLCLIG